MQPGRTLQFGLFNSDFGQQFFEIGTIPGLAALAFCSLQCTIVAHSGSIKYKEASSRHKVHTAAQLGLQTKTTLQQRKETCYLQQIKHHFSYHHDTVVSVDLHQQYSFTSGGTRSSSTLSSSSSRVSLQAMSI